MFLKDVERPSYQNWINYPSHLKQSRQHMELIKLEEPVEPPFSHVIFYTHVFNIK